MGGMGQDVDRERFDRRDFSRFGRRLREETAHLHALVEHDALSRRAPVAGLELEAWLVDEQGRPAPRNDEFLACLGHPDVVTELGRFNVELNVPPQPTAGGGLARLAADLAALWSRSQAAATGLGLRLVAVGILPSLRDEDLRLANLSDRARYRALNEQVLRQRHGRAVQLDIDAVGSPPLRSTHRDVMLEAAATSFQVHLQVPADLAVRTYNAALLASAPLLAAAANSPLLFGRALWQETRIPLFEQALDVGAREDGGQPRLGRVGFGSGYAGWSLVEPFQENLDRFEPLLPLDLSCPTDRLAHLRLHNGTIWRWNRPLLGFDPDGQVHLRVEHRPLPAAPSLADAMANLTVALGLMRALAGLTRPPESQLPFDLARANFYAAARDGLQARLHWPGIDEPRPAGELLLGLLPLAADGLRALEVPSNWADAQLALIEARVRSGCTGSAWQLARLQALGGDLQRLTLDYAARQAEGGPVHTWH